MLKEVKLRFVGPYDVIEKINPPAYCLALPLELQHVHTMTHILQLCHCTHDTTHAIVYESLEAEADGLTYGEKNPMKIVD